MAQTLRPAQRCAIPNSYLEGLLAQRIAQELRDLAPHDAMFENLSHDQLHTIVGEIVAQTFRQFWAANPPASMEHN